MSQDTNLSQTGWLNRFAYCRPVIFSLLVILVSGLLTEIPFHVILEPIVGSPDAGLWEATVGHTLTSLLLVGLLIGLGRLKRAGFTGKSHDAGKGFAFPRSLPLWREAAKALAKKAPVCGRGGSGGSSQLSRELPSNTGSPRANGIRMGFFLGRSPGLQPGFFTPPGQWRDLWLVWPLAILTLLNSESLFSGNLVIDTSRPGLIVLYVARNLAIGFCEEVMGRGVVLAVMLRKWGQSRRGIYRAVMVSSALFGVAHIFNLLAGRLPPLASLTQIIYSFVFGVAFAACFLRNNSIWPVVVIHAAIDIGGGLRHIAVGGAEKIGVANTTWAEVAASLIVSLPLLLYSLFILRKTESDNSPGNPESLVPMAGT